MKTIVCAAALMLLAACDGSSAQPETAAESEARIAAACDQEWPGNRDRSLDCQIDLLNKSTARIIREHQENAARNAGG